MQIEGCETKNVHEEMPTQLRQTSLSLLLLHTTSNPFR
jgi:hypothetical protein